MKQHKKWLNETLNDKKAKKFESETLDVTTLDQAIHTVSETSWRGALDWAIDPKGGDCDWHLITQELESSD